MDGNAYQLLAIGARYWFVLLAALLVWRGALALLHEHYQRRKLLKKLPDAGMVGEMREIDTDRAYPLPREGVLGGGRGCDIRLRGLRRRAVNFAFVEGKGLLLTPCHSRSEVLLDGVPLHKGGYALHGAMLRVGGYTLRVRLFAGLNVPHPAPYEQHWQQAYEEDELYAPEYAAYLASHYAAYDGAFAQQGAEPPPAFDYYDDAVPMDAPAGSPVQGYSCYPYMETQPVMPPQPSPMPDMYAPPAVAMPPAAPMPAQPLDIDTDDAPAPFEGSDYAPRGEDVPAPFEAPRRHRRSDRRQGK